jgi:hypothetical protein
MKRQPSISLAEALRDHNLLGAALGRPETWTTWLSVMKAASGQPLDLDELATFKCVAGNRNVPRRRPREIWAIAGRGSGKSRIVGAIAVHAGLLSRHRLSPGEQGFVLVLSPTVAQAKVVFHYALGFIEASPVLRRELYGAPTQYEIRLRNRVTIATHPNSYRSVRGRTILTAILDEASFFRDEASASPDVETHRAVLPSLIRTGGQLIGISTPYRKLGLLYQKHRDHFGVDDDDVLVVQGSSRTFNPTLSETDISAASLADPEAGRSEWDATFRDDISAFLSEADIDACIDHDRPLELPPRPGIKYFAFGDASGGRHDSFAIALVHREPDQTIVIDVIRAVSPPFDPQQAIEAYASLIREYGVHSVTSDAYAAEWVATAWKRAGISHHNSELPKSQLYLEGLPTFTRRLLRMPNHPRLLRELRLLERRTHVGGKDSVDHGRTGSDDLANAMFGAIAQVTSKKQVIKVPAKALAWSRRRGPMRATAMNRM